MVTIGQTLKLLRTAANLKQKTVAKDLGVTVNYLSLIENGHREPSLSFLKKFAERFDVPLGYFLWLALDEHHSGESVELREKMNKLLALLVRTQGHEPANFAAQRS